MKIRFKYLHFINFLSFDEANINFDDSGYTLVCGINNNPEDCAKSNGAGKSAIFEAISWVLTGETIRGSSNVVNINANNGCFVELIFDCDNKNYKIIRTKDYKPLGTNLKIYIDQEDKSGKGIRDTSKLLEQYLPDLNSSLIGSVILLGQGLPQRFTNNTPSGRKEILEKLSKSDFMIEDLKKRINNRKSELSSQIRNIEDEIIRLETKIGVGKKNLEGLLHEKDNVAPIEFFQEEYKKLLKSVDSLETKKEENISREKILEIDIEELNKSYNEASINKIKELNEINDQKEINKLELQLREFVINKKNLDAQIDQMTSIVDTCPYCGQKLIGVEKPDPSEKIREKEELQNKIEEIRKSIEELKNELIIKKNSIEDSYKDKLDSLQKSIKEKNYLLAELKKETEKVLGDLNYDKNKSLLLENKINEYNQYLLNLNLKISSGKEYLKNTKDELLYNNNRRDELLKHEDIIIKMSSVITRDFRGYLLTYLINYIDKRAKIYSQEVFGNSNINFALDGNSISISYNRKDYSNLSGGERQKIDLIVQFSIRDMLCKYLNFSSNIIAIDELFDNLDSVGCENVLTLISKKLTDVENIYIISHHTSIPIPFDNILTVVKGEDGFSHLK